MQNINSQEIINLFKINKIDWFVNINLGNSKTLEYSPLYDDVSLESSDSLNTSVTIIKNNKKAVFAIDGYSIEKIDLAIKDMLKIIDFGQYDEDIVLPNITDNIEKDFSNLKLNLINFDDLNIEFEKFKNFKFKQNISIESFSIWVSSVKHIYINSLWSVKIQIDNSSYYYMDIFWEIAENRDNHYKYVSQKEFPEIKNEDIEKLQEELIYKISPTNSKIAPWLYDIVLDREVVGDFLEIILWNISAESIRESMSLFSSYNIWDKIFSSNFTLINNPELENYVWTMLFDKEWVTMKKTTLFEKWVFNAKLIDYKNALKEWMDKLWNSTISNIELIWEVDKNYLVWCKILFTNLMAFHTIDEITWKFSLNGEWYLLDDKGNKVDYIKNISLSWDIINLFSNIKSIWDDFMENGNLKVPSISFYSQKIV